MTNGSSTPAPPRAGSPVSTRQLAPVAFGSAAITVWLAALGLVTTPYMLHRLGTSAYAIFALVTIVMAYLSNLELGFGHATLRFLARARAEGDAGAEARIVSTSLVVFCSAAAVAAVLALVLAPFVAHSFAHFPARLEDDAVDSVRIAAILLILTFLIGFANASLQALGRFKVLLWTRLVSGTCMSIAAISLAALFGDVRIILLGQAVISTAVSLVVFTTLRRAVAGRIALSFDRPTFRRMRSYAGLVLATGVAYQLLLQGPPTVLAGVAAAASLTAYAVPAIVLQQLTLLVTATSTGFMPFASAESAAADPSRLVRVFRSHMRMTTLAMVPISGFLAIFAHTLLSAWVSADFADDASAPLRFLAVAGLALALGSPASDVARGLGRPIWTFVYSGSASLIALGCALALADRFEAAGAAAALLVAISVTTVPMVLLATRRLLNDSPAGLLQALAAPGLVAGLACLLYWLGSLLTSALAGAAAVGLVVTAAYAAAAYTLVLDDFERATLRDGFRRRRASRLPEPA